MLTCFPGRNICFKTQVLRHPMPIFLKQEKKKSVTARKHLHVDPWLCCMKLWFFGQATSTSWASLVAQLVKNPPASAGDTGSIPGSERSPGEGNGNPLQYSCLGNLMNRRAWWATVQGSQKSQTQLSDQTTTITHSRGITL